ncbi:MAG: glutamine synthetase [Clostridiales bacterium]|nr:glutamine synthetase [Clostridiales bacterium]
MNETILEALQFVEENDVKFIRLAFCDIFGRQKNISIMPKELPRAFESGISFDASAIRGFMNVEESDLFLVPEAGTISILPWRPSHGRVMRFFSNIKHPDGTPFEGDGRYILKKAVQQCANMGYVCKIGTECEFYLFETDEKGNPTDQPHDHGTYCDIAPLDKGENVRREICLTLEEMGLLPESSHHEQGPGQNEIDFQYSDAMTAADNLITFRSAVKVVAARNGLYASFMPKPIPGKSGSGMHTNISLSKNGENIFRAENGEYSPEAKSFIAGIMEIIPEITLFLNPTTNSYARFGEFEAPKYITWSHQNRSQLVRIPAATGEFSRMELRSPDLSCNPYLAFSLLIHAGLEGIKEHKTLSAPSNYNLYEHDVFMEGLTPLPKNLGEAIVCAEKSRFLRTVFTEDFIQKFLEVKRQEWRAYIDSPDKFAFERDTYFYAD